MPSKPAASQNSPNHGYAIMNRQTGEIYKFGVIKTGFQRNGASRRAQAQLSKLASLLGVNRSDLESVVLRSFATRQEMFDWERATVGIWRAMEHKLPMNIRPKGTNPFFQK
jgi:hypothetical protein